MLGFSTKKSQEVSALSDARPSGERIEQVEESDWDEYYLCEVRTAVKTEK